jgi:hypothetical protein
MAGTTVVRAAGFFSGKDRCHYHLPFSDSSQCHRFIHKQNQTSVDTVKERCGEGSFDDHILVGASNKNAVNFVVKSLTRSTGVRPFVYRSTPSSLTLTPVPERVPLGCRVFR